MPIICFGPVCIPVAAVWPILILLIKPIWDRLEKRYPWLNDYTIVKRTKAFFSSKPKQKVSASSSDIATNNDNNTKLLTAAEVSNQIIVVTDLEHWSTLLATSKHLGRPLIVDFSATWCKPCKRIAPLYHDLALEFGERAIFTTVDVDQAEDVASQCQANVLPTFQAYQNERLCNQFVGAEDQKLKDLIHSAIQSMPLPPN